MTEFETVPPSVKLAQTLMLLYLTKSNHDIMIKGTRSAGAHASCTWLHAQVGQSCRDFAPHPPFSTVLNKQYYTLKQKKKNLKSSSTH